ncbi:MAG: hypothetical protein KBF75_07055 [Saprospiraceae bacterium]|nr:hypothetical protein [Saprospiraceae bacterium]MCA0332391.1 hypothetical protein [Bacteroidota bacterium]
MNDKWKLQEFYKIIVQSRVPLMHIDEVHHLVLRRWFIIIDAFNGLIP